MKEWEVSYPPGLIRYINLFRIQNFNYAEFNRQMLEYACRHAVGPIGKILSVGAGTGTREQELASRGYEVHGLERHVESLSIAGQEQQKLQPEGLSISACDFLDPQDVKAVLGNTQFDLLLMISIPVSLADHVRTAEILARNLRSGGVFLTGLWGWSDTECEASIARDESSIEVACDPEDSSDFAVRLNYYRYRFRQISWDAVYLYKDANGQLRMDRDHDELAMSPEGMGEAGLPMPIDLYEQLPTTPVADCPALAPPGVYEYFAGWRKL